MPSIVHFEIPADDIERARKFYGDLFGWKIEKAGPMDYWMINTKQSETDPGIDGGLMPRQSPQQTPVNYIDVPSVDEYTAKVESLGGKVGMPKTAVPQIGYFAICLDTENNPFGIWEDNPQAK
jgi:uncharacterized protein